MPDHLHLPGREPPPGFDAGLVARVLECALATGERVHAIAGLQGAGKSTLAAQLVAQARRRGLRAHALSIDDFYRGPRERQRLGREVHPLLATRGPPGTHDVELACETLERLAGGLTTRVPRFDKLTGRRMPPSRWPRVQAADLVVFEGWCLKVPPQQATELKVAINPLERDEDPHGVWRCYCNAQLRDRYPALWSRLPRLLYLRGPDFGVVPGWRWQQEQALQARSPARTGMTQAQVERFVQLFERVSRQAMDTLPQIADATITLAPDRSPTGCSQHGAR
ncbi:MAG: kinase [Pseudomonadota bacterium]|nr:kinase [Pseudomonadota bacterium]